MRQRTILTLVVHSDPHHGWLEIPKSLAFRLGITQQVARFARELGGLLFIDWEQADIALQALKDCGYAYEFDPKEYAEILDIPQLPIARPSSPFPSPLRLPPSRSSSGRCGDRCSRSSGCSTISGSIVSVRPAGCIHSVGCIAAMTPGPG